MSFIRRLVPSQKSSLIMTMDWRLAPSHSRPEAWKLPCAGIRLFQWETLVLGLDPLIRSPLALFTDRSDFAVPPFRGGVGEILHGYFDPDIIAGFVVPNVPHLVGSILLFVTVALFLSDHCVRGFFGSES